MIPATTILFREMFKHRELVWDGCVGGEGVGEGNGALPGANTEICKRVQFLLSTKIIANYV